MGVDVTAFDIIGGKVSLRPFYRSLTRLYVKYIMGEDYLSKFKRL
jgi:hypothetical protein